MKFQRSILMLVGLSWVMSACGSGVDSDSTVNPVDGGAANCPVLEGTSWVPEVSGTGAANHEDVDATTGVKSFPVATQTGRAHMIAINRGYSETAHSGTGLSDVVTLSIDMTEDLLSQGSLSLQAEVTGVPDVVLADGGLIYPALISLTDSAGNDFVKLSGCASGGFFTCASGSCSAVASCGPTAGSAFLGSTAAARRDHWEQYQRILTSDQLSVNSFPTCNWTTTSPVGDSLACPFRSDDNNSLFSNGKLRAGTYTAKYVLMTNYIDAVPGDLPATLKLSVVRKRDGNSAGASRGALDLNVVLVGSKNIADSRTEKGKQNLNALFTHVYNHYSQSNAQIKIGKISVYEWTCENGGDGYANVSLEDTGALFKEGSALMPEEVNGKAVNVFLVSTFGSNASLLGRSGGIVGAMLNGTTSSGTVFASFDALATYNASCDGVGVCPIESQDYSFIDMGSTFSHEVGHFLGLNHPTESAGTAHDWVIDTPLCTQAGASGRIGIASCLSDSNVHPTTGLTCSSQCAVGANQSPASCGGYDGETCFCPAVVECQFNHIMWYSSKLYGPNGIGDGNLFSPASGDLLNYSSLVQ